MTNQQLINDIKHCINTCEYCAHACLNEEDVASLTGCIKITRDCADICTLTLKYLARESKFTDSLVELCANVCAACASECEKHDHEHCKDCAEVCSECKEKCREYLKS